ncbi:hypothetical protein HYH03_000071 [Edaphochlamys debaryana]|uniref:DUF4460 domain-containing protein n=1 Tax=Edaphochlamys debaryana TaxID=47281 RepID=A0A836C730_9CHLO|nr:hypothetical protein HYH03_000071 [Edaphochlamys debaryana]|eukprot:KAG2501564.1 hypothetical protein HYH03_000071 [Edaphochlamys debaryana]
MAGPAGPQARLAVAYKLRAGSPALCRGPSAEPVGRILSRRPTCYGAASRGQGPNQGQPPAAFPAASAAGGGGSAGGGRNGGGGAPGNGSGGGGDSEPGGVGSGPATPVPLRAALRMLYLRVHPDLFAKTPKAKAENERSFKLLQEYTALAKGGDPRSPAARVPYRFVFYLRERPAAVAAAGEAEAAPRPELEPVRPVTPPLRPRPGETSPPKPAAGAAQAAAAAAASTGAPSPGAGAKAGGAGANAEAEAEGDEVPGLYRVAVMLPPPAISPEGSRAFASPTRKALAKLLTACGVATTGRDEAEGAEGAEGGAAAGEAELSLAALLPDAVEELRQAEASSAAAPAVRVANLRGALRLRHQVMVSFADKRLPPAQQVALLERLARVVEAEAKGGLKLAGCHIVIGDRLGLDRLGQLCLAASEPDDVWASFLVGADLDFVRAQRAHVQAIRVLEGKVSGAAGLAQIYTPYAHLTDPAYRAALEALAAEAAARGPLGGGQLKPLTLCIVPPAPQLAGQTPEPPVRLDPTTAGVMVAESDVAPAVLYDGAEALGPEALAGLKVHREAEKDLGGLAERTRQRLRLRGLTRDSGVKPEAFKRLCGMLLEQQAALTPLLEGCRMRVTAPAVGVPAVRVAADGSGLEVASNVEL